MSPVSKIGSSSSCNYGPPSVVGACIMRYRGTLYPKEGPFACQDFNMPWRVVKGAPFAEPWNSLHFLLATILRAIEAVLPRFAFAISKIRLQNLIQVSHIKGRIKIDSKLAVMR